MIDRVIELSMRHRWAVIMASVALALGGVWALLHVPIDAIPDLSETQVIVFADWPGYAPEDIESQVTRPLVVALQGLAGVRVVRSSSDFSFSMIHVVFEDHVNILAARRLVAEKLAEQTLRLPPGVRPYLAPEAPATGQIFWYVLEGRGRHLGELRDLQDWHIKPQLAGVPGVAEVATVGGFPVEYKVTVDPHKLLAHHVSLGQVLHEISQADVQIGGHVLHSPTAEYLIRATSRAPDSASAAADQMRRNLEHLLVPAADNSSVRLSELAQITLGPGPRRGALEQDGVDAVGGVVMMRYGENPLEVIRRVRDKLVLLQASLPAGVRIVTSYDRTPLVRSAIQTLTTALLEAMLMATVCVLVIMRHFRASLVISLTLPLTVLGSFLVLGLLRSVGGIQIDTNIMSLAGLVISIGVLVDSSIVMVENVMHTLHQHVGARAATGDLRPLILPACQTVGRPMFFSVVIMLLSFLPVFAWGGLEGKMFWPLAVTKSLALATAAVLAVTLVPALCSLLVRGRLRGEGEVWLVRSLIEAYRPLLNYLLDCPAAIVWWIAVTFLWGLAALGSRPQWLADLWSPWTPLGHRPLMLVVLVTSLAAVVCLGQRWVTRVAMFISLLAAALAAERLITPLSSEFVTPLDERTVMDMPITVPRASLAQSVDDLKARDMVLCRFPEVEMVMGKAGRADTPTDPAPVDMIETMVSFRPAEFWPQRKLSRQDAARHLHFIQRQLELRGHVAAQAGGPRGSDQAEEEVDELLRRFDELLREFTYQRNQEHIRRVARDLAVEVVRRLGRQLASRGAVKRSLSDGDIANIVAALPTEATRQLALNPALERVDEVVRIARGEMQRLGLTGAAKTTEIPKELAGADPFASLHWTSWLTPGDPVADIQRNLQRQHRRLWSEHTRAVDRELAARGPETFVRIALEQLLSRLPISDERLAAEVQRLAAFRAARPKPSAASAHHGTAAHVPLDVDPLPVLDGLQSDLLALIKPRFSLQRKSRRDLVGFGGEMDRCVQMPGWTNVWTMPIQNRVDMLSTGVNTMIGIRVLGTELEQVLTVSERVAEVVKAIPGAADVVVDPVRGKGYLSIQVDPQRAAASGASLSDVNQVLAAGLGGIPAATATKGPARHLIRVVFPPDLRDDPVAIGRLPVPTRARSGRPFTDQSELSLTGLASAVYSEDLSRSTTARVASRASWVPLSEVADIRIVEGPATIKGENGLLRNYVRLNVRDRDPLEFAAQAQRVVAERVALPPGVLLEWTGQFEHQQRARRTLWLVLPLVLVLIVGTLYFTYRDLTDALLMLLAVPGALAGGLLAQWLLGYKFSVTVWIGYIACFGMATATGIIMLVYLRQAVERAGGLERISLPDLRTAVLDGAVHRLRPKLLTEATTILSLAPLLWASGVGSEVLRPMVAPVLGGILVADEVIDLFLPVLFYWVRRSRWQRGRSQAANLQKETEQ